MGEQEVREAEEPESWDLDKAERRPPARPTRVVVSVSLSRDDFDLINRSAEQTGMRTSEFIRKAALDAAKHESRSFASLSGGGHGGSIFASSLSSTTLASGSDILTSRETKPAATY